MSWDILLHVLIWILICLCEYRSSSLLGFGGIGLHPSLPRSQLLLLHLQEVCVEEEEGETCEREEQKGRHRHVNCERWRHHAGPVRSYIKRCCHVVSCVISDCRRNVFQIPHHDSKPQEKQPECKDDVNLGKLQFSLDYNFTESTVQTAHSERSSITFLLSFLCSIFFLLSLISAHCQSDSGRRSGCHGHEWDFRSIREALSPPRQEEKIWD